MSSTSVPYDSCSQAFASLLATILAVIHTTIGGGGVQLHMSLLLLPGCKEPA